MLRRHLLHKKDLVDARGHIHDALAQRVEHNDERQEAGQADKQEQGNSQQARDGDGVDPANARGKPGRGKRQDGVERVGGGIYSAEQGGRGFQVLDEIEVEVGQEEAAPQADQSYVEQQDRDRTEGERSPVTARN